MSQSLARLSYILEFGVLGACRFFGLLGVCRCSRVSLFFFLEWIGVLGVRRF